MPDPVTSTPESPPVGPVVPVGLATRLGQIVSAIFGLIALVTAVLNGDHSQETITSLVLMTVTVVTLMGGRYLQAAMAYLGADLTGASTPGSTTWRNLSSGTSSPPDSSGSASTGRWSDD
jgi:hypothetical protein